MDAVTARFGKLMEGPEATLPLDEAALLIAAHAQGDVDVEGCLAQLDRMAGSAPAPTLDGLRALLFRDLGFRGNSVDYYDIRNSYLDHVLDRRTGIPISLAVVTMEVGRRLGVPLSGVSMPGHFLLRDKVDPSVFVDPFGGGALLGRDGCERLFRSVQRAGSVFDDVFLEPVGRFSIVLRMLANLETIAAATDDVGLRRSVLQLRVRVPGSDDDDRLRLARVVAHLN